MIYIWVIWGFSTTYNTALNTLVIAHCFNFIAMDIWALKSNLSNATSFPPSSLSFGEKSWRETKDELWKPVITPYSTWPAASCYNIYVLFRWDGTLLTWPKCSSHSTKNTAESKLHWQLCTCSVWPCESSLTHWDFFWFKTTHQLLRLRYLQYFPGPDPRQVALCENHFSRFELFFSIFVGG